MKSMSFQERQLRMCVDIITGMFTKLTLFGFTYVDPYTFCDLHEFSHTQTTNKLIYI